MPPHTMYCTYDGLLHGPMPDDPVPDCLCETIRSYKTALGTISHELLAGKGPYAERYRFVHPDGREEVLYLGRQRLSPLLEAALVMIFEALEEVVPA